MTDDNKPRDEWDAMAEVTRRPVCAPAERDEHTALRAAVAAERAAVVAWLRVYAAPSHSDADNLAVSAPGAAIVGRLADAIGRGAHIKEMK
jgi:hypothetical protein